MPRYALVLSKGQLVVELPEEVSKEELDKIKSFLNWTYRKTGGEPPRSLFQFKREAIDGAYYSAR